MQMKAMFRSIAAAAALVGATLATVPTAAQAGPITKDIETPVPREGEIALKPAGAASATLPEGWIQAPNGALIVHNVSKPTLTPFLPPAGKANGTAIVIAPGGGFMMLSISSEGYDVAKWLASKGIAAFVLKYRLEPTPKDAAGLFAALSRQLSGNDLSKIKPLLDAGTTIATEDAKEAMRLVRANAAKWHIDPKKVGFMGFSAGAFTTMNLAYTSDASTRPDFIAPIYGPLSTPTDAVPDAPPPMWASIAADDPILGKTDFGLLNAWRARGGSVEFHMYAKGGHGYGFAGTPGTTTVHWSEHFLEWLESRGLYAPDK